MAPPDNRNGDSLDDTATRAHRQLDGGNGHTHRPPEWGERTAEFIPSLPKHRQSMWGRVMASRPVRNIAEYTQAEKRPVPAWIPGAIVTISILLVGAFGGFMYWRGGVDKDLRSLEKVEKLRLEVAELHGQMRDADEMSSYVQVINAYEVKLRENLLPLTMRYNIKLPPMPEPPRASKQRRQRHDDSTSDENEENNQ